MVKDGGITMKNVITEAFMRNNVKMKKYEPPSYPYSREEEVTIVKQQQGFDKDVIPKEIKIRVHPAMHELLVRDAHSQSMSVNLLINTILKNHYNHDLFPHYPRKENKT